MSKLPANITISRYRSNGEPSEGITITIGDERSRAQIVEVRMTVEEFGRAITGLGRAKGAHDATPDRLADLATIVGKKVRAEMVCVPFDMYKEKRDDKALLSRMEREIKEKYGCAEVRTGDLFNIDNRLRDEGTQRVAIRFYDEVQEEPK